MYVNDIVVYDIYIYIYIHKQHFDYRGSLDVFHSH